MRITRKKYERARAVVAAAREQMALVKRWDEALKNLDQRGNVDAITIRDDGSIRYEIVQTALPASGTGDGESNNEG